MGKATGRQRWARRSRKAPASLSTETRVVDFLTVAWLLCVITTLVCELGYAGAAWMARQQPEALRIVVLASVLLFAALVTGALSLVLLMVVWRARRVKPPRGITLFSAFVGLAPALLLTFRLLAR